MQAFYVFISSPYDNLKIANRGFHAAGLRVMFALDDMGSHAQCRE